MKFPVMKQHKGRMCGLGHPVDSAAELPDAHRGRSLTTPVRLRSIASQSIVENGILSSQDGEESLLEIEFDGGGRKEIADFRPHLPVVFQL